MTKSTNGGNCWVADDRARHRRLGARRQSRHHTNRDIVLVATDSGLYRSADEGDTYSAVRRRSPACRCGASCARARVGSPRRNRARAANVGLQCGQRDHALRLDRSRRDVGADLERRQRLQPNGRTTLGVAVPGDSVVYAYSSTAERRRRCATSTVPPTAARPGSPTASTRRRSRPIPVPAGMHEHEHLPRPVLVQPDGSSSIRRDPSRNTVWIGGDLATARSTNGGSSWTIKTWWLYSQVPQLPYAHADHHAAAFKTTGTPTVILGNDGGLNISTDDGATFSSDKNNGLATHLYYTVAGNPEFPNLVIGGTQDNGTRLRTDNGTTHNQVIGGDGMGTAYSQANTNTVIGSSQGSGMRTNLSNNPPDVFQNWVAATARPGRRRASGSSPRSSPAPAEPRCRPGACSSTSRTRACGARNNGGLNWILIGSRDRAGLARAPARAPLPLQPVQPRRESDRPESHRRRRGGRLPRHHHQRRRDLDRHRSDRARCPATWASSPT